MSEIGWIARFWLEPRLSWIGHAAIAVGTPLAVVLLVPGLGELWAGVALPVLISVAAAIYIRREIGDERTAKEAGEWLSIGEHGVSKRQDQVGDLVGPCTAALASWASWLLAVL